MNGKFWKEASYFKVQSWHLSGGTKENHKKSLVRTTGLPAEIQYMVSHLVYKAKM